MPVSVVVALILGLHQAGGPRGRRGRPCPRDLSALLDRARQCAHRLRPDGTVEDVPVEEVRPGETGSWCVPPRCFPWTAPLPPPRAAVGSPWTWTSPP